MLLIYCCTVKNNLLCHHNCQSLFYCIVSTDSIGPDAGTVNPATPDPAVSQSPESSGDSAASTAASEGFITKVPDVPEGGTTKKTQTTGSKGIAVNVVRISSGWSLKCLQNFISAKQEKKKRAESDLTFLPFLKLWKDSVWSLLVKKIFSNIFLTTLSCSRLGTRLMTNNHLALLYLWEYLLLVFSLPLVSLWGTSNVNGGLTLRQQCW